MTYALGSPMVIFAPETTPIHQKLMIVGYKPSILRYLREDDH